MTPLNRPRAWVISDTHFGHGKIIAHSNRPFATVEDMNRTMVERWNAKVGQFDIVYHLGDVAMWKAEQLQIVKSLTGRKRLIMGNHDGFAPPVYTAVGFESLHGSVEFHNAVLTHIPVHPAELERFSINIHGHIHHRRMMMLGGLPGQDIDQPDPRYVNVSVEHTDYQPILLTEALCRATFTQVTFSV